VKKSSNLKIIDFGLSKLLKEETLILINNKPEEAETKAKNPKRLNKMTTQVGTASYTPPEILNGKYGVECDLWSVGVVLYVLLCGYAPFNGEDDTQVIKAIIAGQLDFNGNEWTNVSKQAKDLVKKLICKSDKRLSASEALQHPWVKKYDEIEQRKNVVVDFPNLDTLRNFDKFS